MCRMQKGYLLELANYVIMKTETVSPGNCKLRFMCFRDIDNSKYDWVEESISAHQSCQMWFNWKHVFINILSQCYIHFAFYS